MRRFLLLVLVLLLPSVLMAAPVQYRTATFGGGCFWGTEYAFRKVKGVKETKAGYMGGTLPNPTYQIAHTEGSGYVEVVQVTYDPAVVTYKRLLQVFFENHDPTEPNHTRPRIGGAYLSTVFAHDLVQEKSAKLYRERLQKRYREKVQTRILPVTQFWSAEENHQRYYEKRGITPKCYVQSS